MPSNEQPVSEGNSEELDPLEQETESDDGSDDEGSETSEDPSEEASSPGTDGTSKQDPLLLGRFKSTDELARSYQHLEAEFSRRNNELHRLKSERANTPVDKEARKAQFAAAVTNDPVDAINQVIDERTHNDRIAAQAIRLENEHIRLLNDPKIGKEYQELQPLMNQLTNELGDLVSEQARQDPKTLHALFLMARGVKQNEKLQQAEASGQNKGEKAALKKKKAQTEGASGSKGHVKRKFEDLSLEDMRKELQKGNV